MDDHLANLPLEKGTISVSCFQELEPQGKRILNSNKLVEPQKDHTMQEVMKYQVQAEKKEMENHPHVQILWEENYADLIFTNIFFSVL